LPQSAPSPHQSIWQSQSVPPPQREPRIDRIPGFPGFIHSEDGVYREENGPCGRCAFNTVGYFFGGKEKLITEDEFNRRLPDGGAHVRHLVDFARERGLRTKGVTARTNGPSITDIHAAEAFIILDWDSPSHYVALVRPKGKKYFCLSDSLDQSKREIFYGTPKEAFFKYKEKYNVNVRGVTSFYERTSDDAPERRDNRLYEDEGYPGGRPVRIL
jgi:hypothetical protein